ncbi:MAG: DUF2238 domain-containing protein [Flavobacteriales bacterium]|nr:DUF2238 domain-containing protein [Flavobacteriales bacterium]MCB9175184.1 DUF2238 domain-containing protein [Flavobacteriales bacterium]
MNKVYIFIIIFVLVLTGIFTNDRLTWSLEIFPIVIGGVILVSTYKKFQLTQLAYTLIFIHCLILIYGGMYTYANTPLGNFVRDVLSLDRNPYDRLGHFAQGFVPAILIRELFLRIGKFNVGKLFNTAIILSCMGISAAYELIEWFAALILNEGAEEFLGMQGDQWDTQWDMFVATVGAVVSITLLSKYHNRQLLSYQTQ